MKARLLLFSAVLLFAAHAFSQPPEQPRQRVRTVTIPISIFTKKELKERRADEFVQVETIMVKEDNDPQQILSIRSVSDSPLSIAILVQEDLSTGFNNQLADIRQFIRGLPKGTRVMVAYLRSGSPQIIQRFTDDLEAASRTLRIIAANPATAPRSPYDALAQILPRFDATPTGRRAVLLFSDGLDTTGGLNLASITQSADLERAILNAQRRSVAVYSFYWPTGATEGSLSLLATGGQGALQKLSDQTGGRAFGNLTTPISFMPYFGDLSLTLSRQFALSYISTHLNKGYHPVSVKSTNPEIRIEHPSGYYYR